MKNNINFYKCILISVIILKSLFYVIKEFNSFELEVLYCIVYSFEGKY